FHKIAKYIVTPGVHQPSGAHECMFNKDAWAKLSDKDKGLIELAGKLTTYETFIGYGKDDIEGYKFLTSQGGNEFVQLDPSFIAAAKEASFKWADKQSASNAWFKKAYEHQRAFQKDIANWSKFRLPIGITQQ
ncbi:MAG: C4-dicarboxylate ABC transporter substrate-binding protein, partial [Oceanibaculum sp.]|nr:C4-dicarboxylate ABC transporter substrate-binding protein [Oceanibaculum sp.]